MAKWGKWVGAGLGFAAGGVLGAVLGLGLGTVFDELVANNKAIPGSTTKGDFLMSFLVLVAAIMKADGKVLKSELDYVKIFLHKNFDEDTSRDALKMLQDILKQDIPVEDVALQVKQYFDYPSRLQLFHFLYGIAQADGQVHPGELKMLQRIAGALGISVAESESITGMYKSDLESAYKVLEIDEKASNDQIKAAYRKMAMKHHPDKVSYLGEDIREVANDKFQKINEAYERIKKERGF